MADTAQLFQQFFASFTAAEWSAIAAFLTLVVAVIAVRISHRISFTAKHALRENLFDQRYEVYLALRKSIEQELVGTSREPQIQSWDEILDKVHFLFGYEVAAAAKRILWQIQSREIVRSEIETTFRHSDKRDSQEAELKDLASRLKVQHRQVRKIFEPYLGFRIKYRR